MWLKTERTDLRGWYTVNVSLTVLFFLVTAVPPAADGYHILAMETIAGKSHWNFMNAVLRALTDAGHQVTVFTPFPEGNRENYTEVDTSGDLPAIIDFDVVYAMENFGRPIAIMNAIMVSNRAFCNIIHNKDRPIYVTIQNQTKFDAIVVEPRTVECLSHLANVPIIYAIPSPMLSHTERTYTGHYSNPGSVSHFLSRQAVPSTFAQRLANTALLAYSVLVTGYHHEWTTKITDPRPYDWWPTVRPSIIFQNSHYVTEASRPVTANLVDVGGIHLKPPKSIPKNLLEFLNNSAHGVIYFSFGSTVNMSTLPDHVEHAFRKALSRVPQRVLWRRGEEMKDKPENVMVHKWFPQRELLLHPSMKLFISHGGISGVYEAVDAGVPILGFPLFYDQPRNMGHLVHNEMAISMDLLSVTEDTLFNAIEELINDDKYKKNAMIASKRFKDRPMSPEQSVVYWTEYVVRHKGAPHLKSHALNLTWYQYLLLDVIAAIILVVSLTVFICYKSFYFFCKYILKFSNYTKMKVQ